MKNWPLLIWLFWFVLLSSHAGLSQSPLYVEGRILDNATGLPIPYAQVFNQSTNRGTLSNLEGYFKLSIQSFSDTIIIKYIGYSNRRLALDQSTSFYTIRLKEKVQLLNEISVRPKNFDYLYTLLNKCKRKASQTDLTQKMYYELKSYVNHRQVELVECFFNGQTSGYQLDHLDLKIGRTAIQAQNNRFFISYESSKAITMLRLFDKQSYFPENPLTLSKRKMKKQFTLRLVKAYQNAASDSILVVKYQPKVNPSKQFTGKIWVNVTQSHFIKMTLSCQNCTKHPFLPLFPNDTIANVNLNITKSFEPIEQAIQLKHTDFDYEVTYHHRDSGNYIVSTNAIMYAYDHLKPFSLPKFEYTTYIHDYRKFNMVPYNGYFWRRNQELSLTDTSNTAFYNHPLSITNQTLFSRNQYFKNGILEHPFIIWKGNRILMREFFKDSTYQPRLGTMVLPYQLSAKIYLDVNRYADSTQVISATIFDPYVTYYQLEMNRKAQCFINMYFDLVEIERRTLHQALLASDLTDARIDELYAKSQVKIERLSVRFFKAVEHGENEREMIKWNAYIKQNLGIDNLLLFDPYADDQPEK